LPIPYPKIEVRIEGVYQETVLSYLPDELAKVLELSIKEIRP